MAFELIVQIGGLLKADLTKAHWYLSIILLTLANLCHFWMCAASEGIFARTILPMKVGRL